MTDRELLERAARAAGIEHDGWIDSTRYHRGGLERIEGGGFAFKPWNPLEDDGDAFRLMVALGITVGPESADVIGKSLCRVSWLNRTHSLGEYGDGDPLVATRRAIVRAAAAMVEE